MSKRPHGGRCLFAALFVMLVGALAMAVGVPWSQEAAAKGAPKAKDGKTLEVLFLYASEKEEWIKDVTAAFNKSHVRIDEGGGPFVRVRAVSEGSAECVDDVLTGRLKADMISPASGAFLELGNAESKAKSGKELVGPTRHLVLSPAVIAMWKPMAEALGWPDKPVGWSDLRALATARDGWASWDKPLWGSFKFEHGHADHSGSGRAAVFAEMYAAAGKTEGLTVADVASPKVGEFVCNLEKSVVHYGNSTDLFGKQMFGNGPQHLSAAVLYENMVIESYGDKYKDKPPFPVVAIYPKEGTFMGDHPIGIVQREWVSEERKKASQLYIDFLFKGEQQQKALKYGFRPGLDTVKLGAPIDAEHGVNPKEPKVVLDPPPVDVLKAGLDAWRRNKKHSHIVLVFDRSVGMNFSGKLANAKKGAKQIVSMLGDEDILDLLAFSDTAAWAEKGVKLKDGRDRMNKAIDGLSPEGETALYDTIDQAYQELLAAPQPDMISAVVVLCNGEDNKSKVKLDELVSKIKADGEHKTIRVFTIAYGEDASEKVLQAIAEATRAKSYKGTPGNIGAIFEDIATFF